MFGYVVRTKFGARARRVGRCRNSRGGRWRSKWLPRVILFYSIEGMNWSIMGVNIRLGNLRQAMALKTQKKRIEAPASRPRRKSKFQADLAPAEDRSVRLLKEELQLSSNTDFLSDAVALFRWAV